MQHAYAMLCHQVHAVPSFWIIFCHLEEVILQHPILESFAVCECEVIIQTILMIHGFRVSTYQTRVLFIITTYDSICIPCIAWGAE